MDESDEKLGELVCIIGYDAMIAFGTTFEALYCFVRILYTFHVRSVFYTVTITLAFVYQDNNAFSPLRI